MFAVRIKLTTGLPFKTFIVHVLTPFPAGGRLIYPLSLTFHNALRKMPKRNTNFFKFFSDKTKCARLQNAIGRTWKINSIMMICVIIYEAGISRGGGRAFFDKKVIVKFCRLVMYFMAATSISRRICQRSVVITFEDKRNSGLLTKSFHMDKTVLPYERLIYLQKREPTNCDCSQVRRLCVFASGSMILCYSVR